MIEPTDNLARAAAELIYSGQTRSIADAIAQVRAAGDHMASPSVTSVRRHLESLQQTAMGMQAWHDQQVRRLELIEELLQTLAYLAPDCSLYVTGRAAEGHVDGTAAATIRVVGVEHAPALMDDLESHGTVPMQVSSLQTSMGSMAVAHLQDALLDVDLIFLPDKPTSHTARRVTDDRPVPLVDMKAFSAMVASCRSADHE